MALVVVAVVSAADAAAQLLNRTSQWTDHPIRPGVTSIKAVHFDELRARVAALRAREGLAPVRWTDPVLTPGATTVRRVHVAELRTALRAGAFSERDRTTLPTAAPFAGSHIDLDAAALDADGDGLLDLVIVGTQRKNPFYDGWFVQLLMNRGDRTFADETSLRLQPHEQSSGNPGVATGAPWAERVDVVDFNGDGAPDFVMSPTPSAGITAEYLRPNQPLIWLNDGGGRFSALKVHDFVRPGYDWLLLGARLVRTRHGYSYIVTRSDPGSGLILTGLLATRPYR